MAKGITNNAGKCVSLHALKKEGTMKTAIKLVLIYFVMQILAALLVMPFAMLYSYAVSGTIDAASVIAFTGLYLCSNTFVIAPRNNISSKTGPNTEIQIMPSQPDCNTSNVAPIQSGRKDSLDITKSIRKIVERPIMILHPK